MKKLVVLFILLSSVTALAQAIDSTDVITVRNIILEGNEKTKERYITRELSFEKSGSYQRWELDSMFVWDRNRIYNTNLFNEIDFSIVNESNGNADIKIVVQERWYFYPNIIFRLADRNINDWRVNHGADFSRVNLGMKLTQYNFRGRGERLRVTGQVGFESRLSFNYQLPYIDKKQKVGLEVDVNYLETKNIAYNTEESVPQFVSTEDFLLRSMFRNRIILSYRPKFYSYHFLTVSHLSAHIADTVTDLNSNYFIDRANDQKYTLIGYSFLWDKRNNRNYPTNGSLFGASLSKYGIGKKDDINFWRATFNLSKYFELGSKNYYAGNAIGVFTFPQEKSYFNYTAIGFQRIVLRGYDLKVIEGSSYVIQKNEIKRKLFDFEKDISSFMPKQFSTFPVAMYAKIFYDQGYAKGHPGYNGSDLLDDQYVYSYGLGVDFILVYDFVLRLELSRNKLNQNNFFINIKFEI